LKLPAVVAAEAAVPRAQQARAKAMEYLLIMLIS
jgi:hypothetical protein